MRLLSREDCERSDRAVVDEKRFDGGERDMATKGMSAAASASHAEALAGFGADLDTASKDVVDEMRTYEEVRLPTDPGSRRS